MESRARLLIKQTVCIPCAEDRFFQLDGSGIWQKKIEAAALGFHSGAGLKALRYIIKKYWIKSII